VINQGELAETLGISVTPLRGALRRLEGRVFYASTHCPGLFPIAYKARQARVSLRATNESRLWLFSSNFSARL
jgi:DNA-binding FadR family transcriptional regulator